MRLPAGCPGCGGELALERVAVQHVEDLPAARPLVTRYQIQIGRCRSCGRRVQPHHPGQTSDALGAAGTQLGPRAVALGSWLSKGLGVPAGKIVRLLGQLGLRITPGGVVQAVARAGRACQPTYQALAQGMRASPVVAPDETGWRVGGMRAWLWTFVGEGVTVYRIACGRGYQDAAAVLGEDYAGTIEPYVMPVPAGVPELAVAIACYVTIVSIIQFCNSRPRAVLLRPGLLPTRFSEDE